jgi:hypothetical protein
VSHGDARPVATLWQLALNDNRVFCTIYRDAEGLQLRVESPTTLIVSERFELQPRTFARAQALRASLKRCGWQECTPNGGAEDRSS